MLYDILTVVHVFLTLLLIGFVLIQQGKGAEVGSAFGAGAKGGATGPRPRANFLTRTTGLLAILILVNSIVLVITDRTVTTTIPAAIEESTPL